MADCELAEAKIEYQRREASVAFSPEEVELARLAMDTALARQYQARLGVEKAGGESAGELLRGQ